MFEIIRKIIASEIIDYQAVAGGCINQAYHITSKDKQYFIKLNSANKLDMFTTEKSGLQLLQQNSQFIVPKVYKTGIVEKYAYFLMQYIQPQTNAGNGFWQDFATKLVNMHKQSNDTFGLKHNNFIGSLAQANQQHNNWHEFYIEQRLMPLVKIAYTKNLLTQRHLKQFESLYKRLEDIVPKEPPAFLHGDLWSGNYLISSQNQPVLIDPSVHYGHRETELAFMHMFGGFDTELFNIYNEIYPLAPDFSRRIAIQQLYPNLVHLILFGTSYLTAIEKAIANRL